MTKISEIATGNIWRHMNMSLEPKEDGSFQVLMEITDDLIQYYGNVHGGAIATLMDTCISSAINQQIPLDQGSKTVEMKINYLRPVNKGILRGQGQVIKKGKQLVVAYGEITDDSGSLIAFGTATFMLFNAYSGDAEPQFRRIGNRLSGTGNRT